MVLHEYRQYINHRKINDNLGEITGSFTLHGVTKTIATTITFLGEVDVPWGQHRAGFKTSFNIKRSDYGMDNLLGPAGDNIQIQQGSDSREITISWGGKALSPWKPVAVNKGPVLVSDLVNTDWDPEDG